jgi:hypothetical protein
MWRQVRVLGAWSVFVLSAAGCGNAGDAERGGSAQQALSPAAERALSFEAPTSDWSVSSGAIGVSDVHADGAHSLALPGGGYRELTSAMMSSLGPVGSTFSLDVQIPAPDPNPFWHGTLRLVVDLPSQGVYAQSLGEKALSGPAGSFQRLEFVVPDALLAKLRGTYSDLKLKIVANLPSAAGPWLVDRLSVGLGTAGPPPLGPTQCGPGGRCLLMVRLPRSLSVADAGLVASERLTLADSVHVVAQDSSPAAVANVGRDLTRLGADAKTGDIWSMAPVELRDRAEAGVVRARALTLDPGASVASHEPGAELTPLVTHSWVVSPPAAVGPAIELEPDQSASRDPGAYGAVAVKSRAKLTLKSGTYFLSSLSIEPDAELRLEQGNGPVFLYVLGKLSVRGQVSAVGGATTNLLIGALGTERVLLEAPLAGTVVVPNAELSFSPIRPANYTGAFYGKRVSVEPMATIRLGPSLVLTAGTTDRKACIEALGSTGVDTEAEARQLSRDQLALCLAPGIPDCAATMISAVNMDRSAMAMQYMAKSIGSADYLALSRDRGRKRHALLAEPGLLQAYCVGDADGDLVPDSADACAGTPPLTPTDDQGCTDTSRPPAVSRDIVDGLLAKMGFLHNQKCDGYGTPPPPTISSVQGSFSQTGGVTTGVMRFRVWRINGVPQNCDLWYEFDIYDPQAPAGFPKHYSLAFHQREFFQSSAPDERPQSGSARTSDAGDRGLFARSFAGRGSRQLFISTRATTGSGQQSIWSTRSPEVTLISSISE